MPWQELSNRRDLLKMIGVAVAGAAIPTAFFLGRSSAPPSTPETPRPAPEPTKKTVETAPATVVSQPKPTARPTVFIPELATPSPARLPTPRPAEKPRSTETLSGKVWEIPVRDGLKKPFIWTGNRLFIVSAAGVPTELNPQNKSTVWEWEGKGVVVGTKGNLLYLFNYDSFRGYALDINSKNEVWKYTLPGQLFANTKPSEQTAALVNLRFWISENHIVFETSEGLSLISKDKKERVVWYGQVLYLSDSKVIYKIPSTQIGGLNRCVAMLPFGDDPETWEDVGVGAYVADDETIVYQKYSRGVPGISAGPSITPIYAREIKSGNIVWQQQFNASATPVFLSKDIFAIQDPDLGMQSPYYHLFARKSFQEIDKIPKDARMPYKFLSRDNWTFAVHPRNGTKAFKDGVLAWENDDILGITSVLGETDGKLVLSHDRASAGSGDTEGAVWVVDARNGKKVPGFPVYFDPLMTEPKLLGNKVVVADGIGGKRFGLSVLDISTKAKTRLLTDLFVANLEKLSDSLVLAQTGGLGQKLHLFRV